MQLVSWWCDVVGRGAARGRRCSGRAGRAACSFPAAPRRGVFHEGRAAAGPLAASREIARHSSQFAWAVALRRRLQALTRTALDARTRAKIVSSRPGARETRCDTEWPCWWFYWCWRRWWAAGRPRRAATRPTCARTSLRAAPRAPPVSTGARALTAAYCTPLQARPLHRIVPTLPPRHACRRN